ncbi:MAG: sugar-binding protein [Armatimonadota bacterium]
MNKSLLVSLLTIIAAGLSQAALITTPKQLLISKPAKAIIVDGKLDEWEMVHTPYIVRDDPKNPLNSVSSNDPKNPVKGDADYSGRVQLAWDETYLYVAAEVADDHLVGVKPDSYGNQGPAGWFCDSLMLSIASFRQPMKTNSPYSPNPFFAIRYAPPATAPRGEFLQEPAGVLDKRDMYWKLPEGSKWGSTETDNGYTLEAAIPWKSVNYVARPGERVFIAFLAGDVDPGEALNQIGWAATSEKWGTANDMSNHPVFRLADRNDMLGILTTSSDEIKTTDPWSLRVELDALTADATLEKIRVVDAKGRTVLERRLNVKVPKGMTAIELVEFKAGEIAKPGNYAIEEVASINGRSRTVAVMAAASSATTAAAIQPDEVRHMDPDRTFFTAAAEFTAWNKHHYITKKDGYHT